MALESCVALAGPSTEHLDGPCQVAGGGVKGLHRLHRGVARDRRPWSTLASAYLRCAGRTFPDLGRIASRSPGGRSEEPLAVELFGPALVLNVGGTLFRTTPGTLRRAPFFDSMFRQTLEGARAFDPEPLLEGCRRATMWPWCTLGMALGSPVDISHPSPGMVMVSTSASYLREIQSLML